MSSQLQCWQCGVEPDEVFEVTTLDEPESRYVPGMWPASDHQHAVKPPTPEELVEDGHRTLRRVLENW